MTIAELVNRIKENSSSMYLIALVLGIQSGFYIYQLTRIPIMLGFLGVSQSRRRYAFISLALFSAGLTVMIILLGILLSIYPKFNVWISLWTSGIYLALGALCLVPGIILTGIFRIYDNVLFRFFERHRTLAFIGALMLGAVFSLLETPICPSCGSNIGAIATYTLGRGNFAEGLLILSLYSFGECIPLWLTSSVFLILWNDLLKPNTLVREAILLITGVMLLLSASLFFWTR